MTGAEIRQQAAARVIDTRDRLREAVRTMPTSAKLIAGKELALLVEVVDAQSDLVLLLNEGTKP